MFFTREDIEKIHQGLLRLGIKDSELPETTSVNSDDTLAVVQDGKNKKINIEEFFNNISLFNKEGFINITDRFNKHSISLIEAIQTVPTHQRIDGLVITFEDINRDWRIYQFRGNAVDFFDENKWTDLYDYTNYIVKSITPDEEDLTVSKPDKNGNAIVSLKDRVYDESNFSGKGYKILRKNIQTIDGVRKNILTQDMINKPNTIYEIRYDFDLNGAEITIPKDCVLKFTGGKIINGYLVGQNSKISWIGTFIFDNIYLKGSWNNALNPIMFGILEVDNTKTYNCLLETHINAKNIGNSITYKGINNIDIIIPTNPQQIPLATNVDFAGCTISVTNNIKRLALFEYTSNLLDITIPKKEIGNTVYNGYTNEELKNDTYLLIISDLNLWVQNRTGHNYGHTRKDIILVSDSTGYNGVVSTYNNEDSIPEIKYCRTTLHKKTYCNLNFIRKEGSTYITTLFSIYNNNNIYINNISIITNNDNNLGGDAGIEVRDCTNVTLENINIQNSYSRTNYYGYGLEFNNVYNLIIKDIKGKTNWGFCGGNNLNTCYINNCQINRFDIHCYGKNISYNDCIFSPYYQQFSGIYGNILYNNCIFNDNVPLIDGSSYSINTPFTLILNDCTYNCTDVGKNYIYSGNLSDKIEPRTELKKKCLPNIIINNLKINNSTTINTFYIYSATVSYTEPISYTTNITINGLTFKNPCSLIVSRNPINFNNHLNITFNKVNLLGEDDLNITQETNKGNYRWYIQLNITYSNNIVPDATISNSIIYYIPYLNHAYTYNNCIIGLYRYRSDNSIYTDVIEFNNCTFYLNCNDIASYYYLDGKAHYNNCNFIFCSNLYVIDYIAKDVIYKNCTTTKNGLFSEKSLDNNNELLGCKVVLTSGDRLIYEYLYKTIGSTENRPVLNSNYICKYFDTTLNKLIYWNGSKWVDENNISIKALKFGTFGQKPTIAAHNIPIGYKYFCTDKQTTEGQSNGIMIYHKGNNIWVDALGRIVV